MESAVNLLRVELLTLKKGLAEIQARCGRQTGGGIGRSGSTPSVLFGGDASALLLGSLSEECEPLGLEDIINCRENFFLALSRVLIIMFSESVLVSAEGGVTATSGLE